MRSCLISTHHEDRGRIFIRIFGANLTGGIYIFLGQIAAVYGNSGIFVLIVICGL